jgi:hypothetical protein
VLALGHFISIEPAPLWQNASARKRPFLCRGWAESRSKADGVPSPSATASSEVRDILKEVFAARQKSDK